MSTLGKSWPAEEQNANGDGSVFRPLSLTGRKERTSDVVALTLIGLLEPPRPLASLDGRLSDDHARPVLHHLVICRSLVRTEVDENEG